MTGLERRPIAAFVVHARQVPAPERVRFATLLHDELAARALIIETCHRVEAYIASPQPDAERLARILPPGGRLLHGDPAVRHAVTVATGRDSVVLGEDQILHQLRGSLDAARAAGALTSELDRLFALALHAGRRARSWRSGHVRSLADVALGAVERRNGPVRGRDVLVVGAGRMGRLAVRAATSMGAEVMVANRSAERARAAAAMAGGRTTDLDPGVGVGRFAAIVVALGGPWTIEHTTEAAILRGRAPVVDLSVPPAVTIALADGLGDRLVTADDLALAEAEPARGEQPGDPRVDALIDQTVEAFLDWQARGDGRAAAEALVRRADLEREAELAALWQRLPALEPEARAAIEGMTRHLAARLLRQPLERLGRDADGTDGHAIRDLFAL